MATKKYSSYAEIDSELEILKLEKEIHFRKMMQSVQKTKESLTPSGIVSDFISSSTSALKGPYGSILTMVAPFVLNKVVPYIKKWISKNIKKEV
jgi:hypothetical protein